MDTITADIILSRDSSNIDFMLTKLDALVADLKSQSRASFNVLHQHTKQLSDAIRAQAGETPAAMLAYLKGLPDDVRASLSDELTTTVWSLIETQTRASSRLHYESESDLKFRLEQIKEQAHQKQQLLQDIRHYQSIVSDHSELVYHARELVRWPQWFGSSEFSRHRKQSKARKAIVGVFGGANTIRLFQHYAAYVNHLESLDEATLRTFDDINTDDPIEFLQSIREKRATFDRMNKEILELSKERDDISHRLMALQRDSELASDSHTMDVLTKAVFDILNENPETLLAFCRHLTPHNEGDLMLSLARQTGCLHAIKHLMSLRNSLHKMKRLSDKARKDISQVVGLTPGNLLPDQTTRLLTISIPNLTHLILLSSECSIDWIHAGLPKTKELLCNTQHEEALFWFSIGDLFRRESVSFTMQLPHTKEIDRMSARLMAEMDRQTTFELQRYYPAAVPIIRLSLLDVIASLGGQPNPRRHPGSCTPLFEDIIGELGDHIEDVFDRSPKRPNNK